MLNVTESVNGKFNIVLSDGYKSQLHDRGKAKTKGDLINSVGKGTRKPKVEKQDVVKFKSKQYREHPNLIKGAKPSRLAAKFNGNLTKNNEVQRKHNNKPKPNIGSAVTNETAAFVSKHDLTTLLKSLSEDNLKNVSAESNEPQLALTDKISQKDEVKKKQHGTSDELFDRLSNHRQSDPPIVDNSEKHADATTKENRQPVAMRSSFAIGAPGLVSSNPYDDKADKHREWIKGLEQQIQDKKEREKQMKKYQSIVITNQLGEREGRQTFPAKQSKDDYPLSSTAAASARLPQELDSVRSGTGYARGRGLMSILSECETEKQKKKILEHQKAIELQVEDRRQQKMEERERRLREEAIEDERVAKERKKLQKQFEEEMIKVKEKEEHAKRRSQVLQEGIAKAHESAQQLKRDKMTNRLQKLTAKASVNVEEVHNVQTLEKETDKKQVTLSDHGHQSEDKRRVVPSLNFRSSTSPVNKSNENVSPRLCDSTLTIKRNSSTSVRDVETSYSEADKNRSETLLNKWVDEDFSSSTINGEQNLYNNEVTRSGEIVVPFHRTASATFTESTACQDILHENDFNDPQLTTGNSTDRKHFKNGRSGPGVQSTKTSRLRETKLDRKNSSFANHRKKYGADRLQQTVQKSKQHKALHETSNDRVDLINTYKNTSIDQGNATTNIPSHLLATFTPTAHQEKILEQLAALRKGLLRKDQEIKTRVFQINEYEIQA